MNPIVRSVSPAFLGLFLCSGTPGQEVAAKGERTGLRSGEVITDSVSERQVLGHLLGVREAWDVATDALSLAVLAPKESESASPDAAPPESGPEREADQSLPLGKGLFLLLGDGIYRVDPRNGEIWDPWDAPRGAEAIVAVGELLYVVPKNWSAGDAITILDPTSESAVGEVPSKAKIDKGDRGQRTRGAAWFDGGLYVLLDNGAVYRVRPNSGVAKRAKVEASPDALALMTLGSDLVSFRSSGQAFDVIASASKGDAEGRIQTAYAPPRAAATVGGRVYLAFSHGIYELATEAGPERLTVHVELDNPGEKVPDIMAPGDFRTIGRTVQWQLGAETFKDPDALVASAEALAKEYRRKRRWDEDRPKDGSEAPLMQVVISADVGVSIGEVSDAMDLMQSAGYGSVVRAIGTTDPAVGR